MKHITILSLLVLVGCNKTPKYTERTDNVGFNVEVLFTYDGCTVYRFHDGGSKYFTNCKGSTSWHETEGKTTVYKSITGK